MAPPAARRWLATQWRFVRAQLPPAPARVVEVGCGPHGGFVPALQAAGYDAIGVDPAAPDGPAYRRLPFDQFVLPWPADAVVACNSLHHVAELTATVECIAAELRPGGVLAVVDWDWLRFDERTARWCFGRLGNDEAGWLHRHRDAWRASGGSWPAYLERWADLQRLPTGRSIVAELADQLDVVSLSRGPYFFGGLDGIEPETEGLAIAANELNACGIYFVGANL